MNYFLYSIEEMKQVFVPSLLYG